MSDQRRRCASSHCLRRTAELTLAAAGAGAACSDGQGENQSRTPRTPASISRGSKVLNFSNSLHSLTTGFGIASRFARNYRPFRIIPRPLSTGCTAFSGFGENAGCRGRWFRKLIANSRFDSFHIHLPTDPGTPRAELPSSEDVKRHNITTSTWFEDKADFNAHIARANIFCASTRRRHGQAFLEAMARRQRVVAPNHATVCEYILPGVNGLLYDIKNLKPLDFSDIVELGVELGRQAKETVLIGRKRWDEAEQDLLQFVLTPIKGVYANGYQHSALAAAPEFMT
jgi:hypothetical protein